MNGRSYKNSPLFVLAAFALLLGACTETMTEVDDAHAEPEGVHLVMGGNVFATYDGETQTWTGELEGEVGQETPHITVRFVDHEGDPIPIDDDLYLDVQVQDESIAEFGQDTPGEFGGHLHGEMAGETGGTFSLMHGAVGAGHPDFVTQPAPAHIR
ncbi:MAG: hypothetical protein OXE96_12485 [Gemmatimonadetes bacterium]|nr:hypothetical protein [Gemmatimonadota bacterium]